MDLRNSETVVLQRQIPAMFWAKQVLMSCLIIPIPLVLLDILRAKTNDLVLTNQRITGKTGIFGTNECDILLDKINSVSSNQGLIGKLFNYGNIIITDNAQEKLVWLTANPTGFKKAIFNAQERYKEDQLNTMASKIKAA